MIRKMKRLKNWKLACPSSQDGVVNLHHVFLHELYFWWLPSSWLNRAVHGSSSPLIFKAPPLIIIWRTTCTVSMNVAFVPDLNRVGVLVQDLQKQFWDQWTSLIHTCSQFYFCHLHLHARLSIFMCADELALMNSRWWTRGGTSGENTGRRRWQVENTMWRWFNWC